MSCSPPPHSLASPLPFQRPPPSPHPPPRISLLPTISSSRSGDPPPSSNVVAWTISISRLARRGHLAAAAAEFSAMLSSTSPNHITLLTLLSACADLPSSPSSLPLALSLHALAFKFSFFSSPRPLLLLSTALTNLYSNAGLIPHARQLFDRMPHRNSVAYNTMIAGHMKNAEINEALDLFYKMPTRNLVSWTAVIDGCVKNGLAEEALEYFRQMQIERVDPDYVTVMAVASACSDLGALGHGMWLHCFALNRGLLANVRVGNSLIDMYSRCGHVDFAQNVFDEMTTRTLVSWNSMIVGLAANGCSMEALLLFSELRRTEFKPDGISFTGALTACSHAGLVEPGLRLFQLMQREYGVAARIEHYGCLVDLLGRAGLLVETMSLVENMPMKPNDVMLGSLLAACRMHGDFDLAERLMALLVQVDPETDSNYVILSNIYAASGRWEGVGRVRSLMKDLGLKKKPGFSAVEVGCNVHRFMAGDGAHPKTDEIYALLDLLHFDMELHDYEPHEAIKSTDNHFS